MRKARFPDVMPGAIRAGFAGCMVLVFLILMFAFVSVQPSPAQTYNVIYRFTAGADGQNPTTGVTMDRAGNLYGTTSGGDNGYDASVFRLTHSGSGWLMAPLDTAPGGTPQDIVVGPNGSLYGAAEYGSFGNCGTVFNDRPPAHVPYSVLEPWVHTDLYGFDCGSGARNPVGALLFDQGGNIYGASYGGGGCAWAPSGCGTVYKLTLLNGQWTENVLYSFAGGDDGAWPYSGVVADQAGNLYGTTLNGGGASACVDGCGTVYELTPTGSGWTETVLYRFQGGMDGALPCGGLVIGPDGNLYGATSQPGVVFELSYRDQRWNFSVIASESGSMASLIMAGSGVLYGTSRDDGPYGYGGVYQLKRLSQSEWIYSRLHNFTGGSDGAQPMGRLYRDANGNLYGTTMYGGGANNCQPTGCGVVFEITP
ncbi:MAG TPA: choice-of-anchor tandem repeat GloVer-containing protein [Candidatus Binatia bacterium]|nr:choice-of-anchor tandem repeat GloVer-containing protein [Candidatus Binatia bacterium]